MKKSEKRRLFSLENRPMNIYILTENLTYRRGLLCEHGLSLLIETKQGRWLFDSGQTDVFLKNAKAMGVSLDALDGIVLSHGHYDHCGGMKTLFAIAKKNQKKLPPVYVRALGFEKKYAQKGEARKEEIGIPWSKAECESLCLIKEDTLSIAPGVWLMGNIPYQPKLEGPCSGMFVLRESEFEQDLMSDEQLLVFETDAGLCVFAGCSHPGILNCLHAVRERFPGQKIHSLLAGMHLMHASKERIDGTIRQLKQQDVDLIFPVHCTGLTAIARMRSQLPDRVQRAECGSVICI